MDIEKLKRHKTPGLDQIPAELTKAEGRAIHPKIHKLILFGIRRNCLRNGWSQSLYLYTRRLIKQTVVITEVHHSSQLHTKFYPTSYCQG